MHPAATAPTDAAPAFPCTGKTGAPPSGAGRLRHQALDPDRNVPHTTSLLQEVIGTLLRGGAEAGAIRPDIGPDDLLRTVVGLCYLQDGADWQGCVMRLVDVFLDGLTLGREPRGNTA